MTNTQNAATWSTVTTCSESRLVLERFVAHHVAMGAQGIFLFFDNPTDLMADVLSTVPRVHVIRCDENYWKRRSGGRPEDHRDRQTFNANFAARHLNQSDWLTHMDADEFLHPRSAGSISNMLSKCPDDVDAVRVLPSELILREYPERGVAVCDGTFKLKSQERDWFSKTLFANAAPLFPSGFVGHEVGKSFRRSRAKDTFINIHFVRRDGKNVKDWVVPQEMAVLLHACMGSFEHFQRRFERHLDCPGYFASLPEIAKLPIRAYKAARDLHGLRGIQSLFRKTCVVENETISTLRNASLILDVDLKLNRKIRDYVRPFEHRTPFVNTSAPCATATPEVERIFQIGMNRAGSREICTELGRAGFSYCHLDGGDLARNLRHAIASGEKPFSPYDNFNVLSGISTSGPDLVYDGFLDVAHIFKAFPKSIYLLNYIPVQDWLRKRSNFRNGRLLREAQEWYDLADEDQVRTLWHKQWVEHVSMVRGLALNEGMKLIEYPVLSAPPGSMVKEVKNLISQRSKHHISELVYGG